jgi:N-acetylmuramoyl-L-alanine amidase CwlA
MSRILTKEEWRKRRRRKRAILITIVIALFIIILALAVFLVVDILVNRVRPSHTGKETITGTLSNGEIIKTDYLTPNQYSRPMDKLKQVSAVVIHYTANPGTSAENNRSYFEGLASKKTTSASSHYIIGLEGEILQCIPLTEVSYASNDRNDDTISIECCHPDETGQFNAATYDSLISLTAALCIEFDLNTEDVIRHYDITGKLCPLYFVEHEDAWKAFKEDVAEATEQQKDYNIQESNEITP